MPIIVGDSLAEPGMNLSQHDIVCKVLLSDKENVNIVHEIFRQVCLVTMV